MFHKTRAWYRVRRRSFGSRDMQHIRPIVLAMALLISACGATQPAAPPAALQPTAIPETSAPAPTNAPTDEAFVSPSSAPAPSPSPAAIPATAAPAATAE